MPKKRNLKIFLEDIIDEIDKINRFTINIKNISDFRENELAYYAVLKALENIGEAVKHIPENLRKKDFVEWKKIAGLRDIIIHEYFGIDEEIIWDVVMNKLPELKIIVLKLLKNIL